MNDKPKRLTLSARPDVEEATGARLFPKEKTEAMATLVKTVRQVALQHQQLAEDCAAAYTKNLKEIGRIKEHHLSPELFAAAYTKNLKELEEARSSGIAAMKALQQIEEETRSSGIAAKKALQQWTGGHSLDGLGVEIQKQQALRRALRLPLKPDPSVTPAEAIQPNGVTFREGWVVGAKEEAIPPNGVTFLQQIEPDPRELEKRHKRRIAEVEEEERARLRVRDEWEAKKTRQTHSPVQATAAPKRRILKRKALITELERDWLTIRADLSEASRNGLSKVAHTADGWDIEHAKEWADSKGKLNRAETVQDISQVWKGTSKVHRGK